MRSREVEATSRARAWLALALVPGLGPAQARRLAGRAGGPEAARALSPAAVAAAGLDVGAWLEAGVRPWDLAALVVLIEEAGGRFTDFDGGRRFLETGHAVATNSLVHAHVLRTISTAKA